MICKDISGLIVLGTEIKDRHIAMAQAHGVGKLDLPLVMVDNATSLVDLDCVVADNRCGRLSGCLLPSKQGLSRRGIPALHRSDRQL